ncbi:hypothetical protein Q8F55_002528 [Vanrija albida]|uniref:GST N-terminal domain-containing protein n=1 Tax=Vanrija albida TaxID=181172 RepID=A0ABR3QA22_9TREE
MTIDTKPYIVYGLALEKGQNINVGPYAWKTEVDLGTLGVPYKLEGRIYDDIRGSFETETGNPKVTVPTLKTEDGYVTDSWAIAEWAEAKYGTPERSLFGGNEEGKAFARFLNIWADNDLGDQVKILFAPWLYQAQKAAGDDASAAWFLKTKLGGSQEAINGLIKASQDPTWVDNQAQVVRDKLQTIEKQLAANKEAGKGKFLAGTDYPTHGDAAVFGWYAASAAVRGYDLLEKIWNHESLPLVSAWVKDVADVSGAKVAYPY